MELKLDGIECRVLGSLAEKELATPEYYPLSINALVAACNQKSNRHPPMTLSEPEVARALESLRGKHLVLAATDSGRVPKYRHLLYEKLRLEPAEQAVVAELLVRGPQTAGELKLRTERMAVTGDLAALEALLAELAERGLVAKLPRQPGMREQRHAHLFSGEPSPPEEAVPAFSETVLRGGGEENERLALLEEELRRLGRELDELRRTFAEFRAQFD